MRSHVCESYLMIEGDCIVPGLPVSAEVARHQRERSFAVLMSPATATVTAPKTAPGLDGIEWPLTSTMVMRKVSASSQRPL